MDVDQQPVVFICLLTYAVIDVFLQPLHFHVFLLYFAPLPRASSRSSNDICSYKYFGFWNRYVVFVFLAATAREDEDCAHSPPKPSSRFSFSCTWSKVYWMLNVWRARGGECLAGLSRLYLVSQQPGQRMEFPLKKLNNLCKNNVLYSSFY